MRRRNFRLGTGPRRPSPQTFRPDIEGLRGVAILLVVFYHIGVPGFAGGYVGVDVFFVLSGYLITGLLLKEIETTGHLRLANFYGRRARRLLPAAALMLSLTCFASYWLLSPVEQMKLPTSAITTAAYTSNIYFARKATAYLPRVTDTIHSFIRGASQSRSSSISLGRCFCSSSDVGVDVCGSAWPQPL